MNGNIDPFSEAVIILTNLIELNDEIFDMEPIAPKLENPVEELREI